MKIEDIKNPCFLKEMSIEELENLSQDIRNFIIKNVSHTGGHLSSNLGIVELSVALHYCFQSPVDKIIFDVGHQSYVHKILTGRASQFTTLRQFNGLSGFQKRNESIHDSWEAGHSSTAISGGIGLATARDLNHEKGEIICVVGDAALMSGESFEALNYLGSISSKVIIILNDNDMSISKNVGGLSNFLSDIRLSTQYNHAKNNYYNLLSKNQFGKKIYNATKKVKDKIKMNILSDNIFSNFGLDYIGPVDGHNFRELISALTIAKEKKHSVVVHVHTIKGKGYPPAENDKKGIYHGVSPFDYHQGIQLKQQNNKQSWSAVVSTQIEYLMNKDKDIVVITPAMIEGSCLSSVFERYPNRCFDVGIAEEHAMTFAAGLSCGQKKPFITIYSSFLQRAYDQTNHDIARMNLPCLIGVDRAGLVGSDGETHHGVFDISILSSIPNLTIMTPKDAFEAKALINTAFKHFDHPYVIRYPKGEVTPCDCHDSVVEIGMWEKVITNIHASLTVITYDQKVNKVKQLIEENKLPIQLINARFIKPLDYEMLDELSQTNQKLIIYETDMLIGSLGSMISHYYSKKQVCMNIHYIGINNHYTPQGDIKELQQIEKISLDDLHKLVKESLNEEGKN